MIEQGICWRTFTPAKIDANKKYQVDHFLSKYIAGLCAHHFENLCIFESRASREEIEHTLVHLSKAYILALVCRTISEFKNYVFKTGSLKAEN